MEGEERRLEGDGPLRGRDRQGRFEGPHGPLDLDPLDDERLRSARPGRRARRVEDGRPGRRRDPDAAARVDEVPLVAGAAREPLVRPVDDDL